MNTSFEIRRQFDAWNTREQSEWFLCVCFHYSPAHLSFLFFFFAFTPFPELQNSIKVSKRNLDRKITAINVLHQKQTKFYTKKIKVKQHFKYIFFKKCPSLFSSSPPFLLKCSINIKILLWVCGKTLMFFFFDFRTYTIELLPLLHKNLRFSGMLVLINQVMPKLNRIWPLFVIHLLSHTSRESIPCF